jgi:undecaprenyl diphosphate synthase
VPATGGAPAAPAHVAIIMDGNRRWARARGLPPGAGHRKGADAVRAAVEGCHKAGVRWLTLFAFSSENWGRPADEIGDLMGLLRHYVGHELDRLHENGVRVRMIGRRDRFDPDILAAIADAERRTADNARMDLVVALDYGARREIVRAVRGIAAKVRAGLIEPGEIEESHVAGALYTAGVPDPDLLIRTSGEQRISNFLLWQLAYTELVFLPVSWPDFTEEHLTTAFADYARRERRYGGD